MSSPVFEFGDFRLDQGRFELIRKGRPLRLERKPMELLLLLVQSRGNLVSRSEIATRLWDSEVFVDTEHGINTAIRKIRQALEDDPEAPRFVQTVPGKGYRFIASVSELGAVYPDPQPLTAPIIHLNEREAGTGAEPRENAPPVLPRNEQQSKRLKRWRWVALAAVPVLAALAIAVTAGPHPLAARIFHPNDTPDIATLAVLPLDNLSGDAAQDYFADGMTDELITQLARNSTLRVTSRTSVMQYKKARLPLREIARALHVDAIVEGSIHRTGKQVHMTLQLIRADSDSHLWASTYDRENDDATLPDEAARAIAARLERTAASVPPARALNPEAHDDYLRGQYLWMVGRNKESGAFFQRAVDLQPDYAAGWAGLSQYLVMEAMSRAQKPSEALAAAEIAAHKALELDDSLWHAHLAMGTSLLFRHWDFDGALKELDRATALDPQNAQAYHLKAKILCAMNRFDDANAAQARSTAANAFEHPGARTEIFNCTRQFNAAIQDGLLRLRDFPTSADVLGELSGAYAWSGQTKEAAQMRLRQLAAEGDERLTKAAQMANAAGGYQAIVGAELAYFEVPARAEKTSPVELARLNAIVGRQNEAIRLLSQAADEHDPTIVFRMNNPDFDSLHNNAQFQAIAERVGLPYEPPAPKER